MNKGWAGLVILGASAVLLAACQSSPVTPTLTPVLSAAQIEQGRELYREWCSTCHGRSGGGIEEARLAFPETHQTCERCHRLYNSPTSLDPADIFSIGQPPPLRGLAKSGPFSSPEALFLFTRSTMPRYNPGVLSDEEYRAITAFLWEGLQEEEEGPAPTVEHP